MSIPHILIVYGVILLLFESPKIKAKSIINKAKEKREKLYNTKEDEIKIERKRYNNNPEVIELHKKLKSLRM